jgi:hypothetical protein
MQVSIVSEIGEELTIQDRIYTGISLESGAILEYL